MAIHDDNWTKEMRVAMQKNPIAYWAIRVPIALLMLVASAWVFWTLVAA